MAADQSSPNVVQATGQVAGDIIGGLKGNPIVLALVVLNILGIGAALWFLRDLMSDSRSTRMEMLSMIGYCVRGRTDSTPDVPGR